MENKKYLIGLDLDGTLLSDEKTISDETIAYLKRLEDEGHIITLCSGRAPRSMVDYYNELGLSSPAISYNGAYVHSFNNFNYKSIEYKIDQIFIKELYRRCINKEIVSAFAETPTTIFYDDDDAFLFAFFTKGNFELIHGPLDQTVNKDTFVYVFKIKDSSDETKNNLIKTVNDINPNYNVRFWRDCDYAEISLKGVSKAKTMLDLMNSLNKNKDEVIVFGDADNDIEMFETFPNSFVMVNGNPKLREIAHYVTEFDNNHNGVIKALEKFLKNN